MAENSYKGILKSTALFGGVQVLNVLVNIIRGKLVAMILGPDGMGISSLLGSAAATIQQFFSLGLNTTAMREISQAKETNDAQEQSFIVAVFRKLVLLAAIAALIFTAVSSLWLSDFSFGNTEYFWFFIILGFVVFFSLLSNREVTLLQGMREYKRVASCSVIGSLCGLLVGVPLYYIFGIRGIAPAMLVLAVVTFSYNRYNTSKLNIEPANVSVQESIKKGKDMVTLGLLMMLGAVIGNFTTYGLNAFIRYFGSIQDVGLYSAANSITNQYTGMVFAAMATDYFPRLAGVMNNKMADIRSIVSQEAEIVLLIITPLAMLIIMTAPLLIRILLSEDFIVVTDIIRYMGFMVVFKAVCFPLGYVGILKNNKTFFFWTECIWTNVKTFSVFSIFYYLWGINGMGKAALCSSILDLCVVIPLYYYVFNVTYTSECFKMMAKLLVLASLCLFSSLLSSTYVSIAGMLIIFVISCIYVYEQINLRTDLKTKVMSKLRRNG